MKDKMKLCEFLVKAKKATYAAGQGAQKTINEDCSTTLVFEEGEWRYQDNYFGGEPFGGREVVLYQGKPLYMMVYYGRVMEEVQDLNGVYALLQEALRAIPVEAPYRGPKEYVRGGFVYKNEYQGEVESFSGREVISCEGKEVYEARYVGGLVDVRK